MNSNAPDQAMPLHRYLDNHPQSTAMSLQRRYLREVRLISRHDVHTGRCVARPGGMQSPAPSVRCGRLPTQPRGSRHHQICHSSIITTGTANQDIALLADFPIVFLDVAHALLARTDGTVSNEPGDPSGPKTPDRFRSRPGQQMGVAVVPVNLHHFRSINNKRAIAAGV